MGEIPEPRLEIHVHFDDPEKFAEACKSIGRLASQPMTIEVYNGDEQLGLFETDYRADSGREFVTRKTFSTYYMDICRPERPSNFPNRLFTKLTRIIPEDQLLQNDRKEVIAIKRAGFDMFVELLDRENVEDIGKKSKEFIRGLHGVLPRAA